MEGETVAWYPGGVTWKLYSRISSVQGWFIELDGLLRTLVQKRINYRSRGTCSREGKGSMEQRYNKDKFLIFVIIVATTRDERNPVNGFCKEIALLWTIILIIALLLERFTLKLGNCFNNNIILQTITISIEMSSSKCKIRKEYLKDSIDSRNNFPVIIIRWNFCTHLTN